MILRTIICGVCGERYTELGEGAGFPGWGHIVGVRSNNSHEIHLCPEHLNAVTESIRNWRHELGLD
jgi:hypothetical protein